MATSKKTSTTQKKTTSKTKATPKTATKKSVPAKSNPALATLKKTFLIGVGATVKTTDLVKDYVDNLIAQGELNQKDASLLGKELVNRVDTERKHLEKWVNDQVRNIIKSLDLVTRKEMEAELKALRKELSGKSSTQKASTAKKSPAKKTTSKKKATSGKKTRK